MDVTGYRARNIGGRWHAVVYWKDAEGRRHQKSKRLDASTEAEAEKGALDYYIDCRSGAVQLTSIRCEDAFSYADRYFKGRLERHEYERSTYATNMKHMRAWKRALGVRKLTQIGESDIRDAIAGWFDDGRDATTVDKRITAFKEVFNSAISEGACMRNPFDNIKRPKKGWKMLNGCNDSSLREEIAETLSSLPLDSLTVAFNLAFWTGMRRGEICALRWVDVNLEDGVVWVRHSIGADGSGCYVKLPKSDRPRDIALTSSMRSMLEAWEEKNGSTPQGFVVEGESGGYMNPDYVTHAFTHLSRFKKWEGAAGKRLSLHDLRHTVATTLISSGADVKTVQSLLGHSSAAITLDMYASADSDAKKKAAALLERSIAKDTPKGVLAGVDPYSRRKEAANEAGNIVASA